MLPFPANNCPLDYFIDKHPDIIPLIDTGPNSCKALLYADDTVFLLAEKTKMAAVKNSLKIYCRASNVKINYDKSTCCSIGELQAEETGIPSLKENEDIKYLGIPFCKDGIVKHDKVWKRITDKMKKSAELIKKMRISLKAKAFCYDLLIVSQGRLIAEFIPPNYKILRQIKDLLWQIL